MTVEKLITDHIDIWSSVLQTRSTAGRSSKGKIDLYGIKKLRELILELAVRGKLVPQDPNDEPASELLKRIAAEKAELVKQGKIKKQKSLPEISEDEKPFELPGGWEWVHLPDIYCSVSESSNKIKSSEILPEGKYPVVEQSQEFISGYCNDESLLIKLDNPVIVFGDHTRNIKFIDFDFVVGADGVKVLSPILICGRYFFWQLRSFKLDVRGYARHFKVLNSRLFALPSIAEQERIVEKVCSLMSLCDQLEQQSLTSLDAHSQLVETLLATLTDSQNAEELAENWARISQHFNTLFTTEASIDALKQTILQLAVMGKLVPQDPNDEPASELLKRIEQEKTQLVKEGKIKKQKPLPPVSDEEKPFILPNGWEWTTIRNLQPEFQNGLSSRGGTSGNDCIVIRLADIKNWKVSFADTRKLTVTDSENKKYRLNSNDILIVRVNGSADIVGGFVLYDGDHTACYCDHFIRLRFPYRGIIEERYLTLVASSPLVRSRINDLFITTAGQKTVNQTHINSLSFPLPPYKEQNCILNRVNELISICDHLKSRLQSAQQTQLYLADALTDAALN
ncbi:restriction endonuclease subunit S domain-containing protein [Citrobacter freundii]|uniref:restriction endonuclease subunit S n=1 Tax=Citrobacter freundii TaxID=546 RepID=UPI00397876F8